MKRLITRIILMLLLIFLQIYLLTACCGVYFTVTPGERTPIKCPAANILLDQDILPHIAWQGVWQNREDATYRIGIDRAGAGFSTRDSGGIVQSVYLLKSREEAEKEFDDRVDGLFQQTQVFSEWTTPDPLQNVRLNADKYRLACASYKESNAVRCMFFAYYGPYLTELSVVIDAVQYTDLITLVSAIDNKAVECAEIQQK